MGVLSTSLWSKIQNIAPCKLLWRKLTLFQPKPVHWYNQLGSLMDTSEKALWVLLRRQHASPAHAPENPEDDGLWNNSSSVLWAVTAAVTLEGPLCTLFWLQGFEGHRIGVVMEFVMVRAESKGQGSYLLDLDFKLFILVMVWMNGVRLSFWAEKYSRTQPFLLKRVVLSSDSI